MSDLATTQDYPALLTDLKDRVRRAQLSASQSVNRELTVLYWSIGRDILDRQAAQGWGSKVVTQLAHDLRAAFPEMKGFSERNLRFMRQLAQAWPEEAIVKQLVSLLPWGHNIRLMQKVDDPERRLWYLQKAVEHGWSRDMLALWIDSDLYARQGAAVTNFERTLPEPQSDLATQTLKDPYKLDFLTLAPDAHERALERGLVQHIRDFLVELGVGFAFMGTQVPITVSDQEMTNASVRERFGIDKRNAATASRYIREAVTAGMIGPEDPNVGTRSLHYVPFWALPPGGSNPK